MNNLPLANTVESGTDRSLSMTQIPDITSTTQMAANAKHSSVDFKGPALLHPSSATPGSHRSARQSTAPATPLEAPSAVSPDTSVEDLALQHNVPDHFRILGPDTYQQIPHSARSSFDGSASRTVSSTETNDEAKDQVRIEAAEVTLKHESDGEYDGIIASAERLDRLLSGHKLARAKGNDESVNQLRHGFFSAYRRIFAVVFIANVVAVIVTVAAHARRPSSFTYLDAATATSANVLVAVLVRHEHVVNALFRIATSLPHSTPLCIRRHAAKIYSYGGVHSACGVGAFIWYIVFTVLLVLAANELDSQFTTTEQWILASTTFFIFTILMTIILMSHPSMRISYHNAWEWCHRFGGWASVALFWVQTITLGFAGAHTASRSAGATLIRTPGFWFLWIVTFCLIYPWLRLRRREVTTEKLSDHALKVNFNHKQFSHPGCATRLTDAPLKETHGFAVLPNVSGEKGYSCVISNAGDWTKKMINNPPEHVWVRGSITFGALNVVTLFKPVIVVATGSGIAPCLSFLQTNPPGYPLRVLWSARFPEVTYGSEIMDAVLASDPNAVIIDTKKTGTPNMTALTWALYKEAKAEAIIIISNGSVTREVVYGMESRGVPAFGAVFDS